MTDNQASKEAIISWVEGNADGAEKLSDGTICNCNECLYKQSIRDSLLQATARSPVTIEALLERVPDACRVTASLENPGVWHAEIMYDNFWKKFQGRGTTPAAAINAALKQLKDGE